MRFKPIYINLKSELNYKAGCTKGITLPPAVAKNCHVLGKPTETGAPSSTSLPPFWDGQTLFIRGSMHSKYVHVPSSSGNNQ